MLPPADSSAKLAPSTLGHLRPSAMHLEFSLARIARLPSDDR